MIPARAGIEALKVAFKSLVVTVSELAQSGTNLDNAELPFFTYLLTPKQTSRIRAICKQEGWPIPATKGVEIDLNAILHPLESRKNKDGCPPAFVGDILAEAYSVNSEIAINREHNEQALIFNAKKKITYGGSKWHALAVLDVREEGHKKYLAPITAYHANEAKIRKIKIK